MTMNQKLFQNLLVKVHLGCQSVQYVVTCHILSVCFLLFHFLDRKCSYSAHLLLMVCKLQTKVTYHCYDLEVNGLSQIHLESVLR